MKTKLLLSMAIRSLASCSFALCGLVFALSGCGSSGDTVTLKMGHAMDTEHPVHISLKYMAKQLEEASGGKVVLKIYPSEQLGSEADMIGQVQSGLLDLVKASTAPYESFVPSMAVFGVPYVFNNTEHFWKVLDGEVGKEMLAAGTSSGLRGLCYFDAGARSFYTKDRPILTPEDLQGLQIRVMQSETAMKLIRALGASPTPIAWGELYTSLQQGTVDGAENNPPSFQTSHHYDVCRHYSLDEHTRVPDIVLISERTWSRLTPELQVMVQKAADEASAFQRKLWAEKTAESLRIVEEAGVTIHRPDIKAFKDKVVDMHASYDGTPVGDIMKRIAEVK